MIIERAGKSLTGLLLLACILLGGGTTPGLARDHALECCIFLAGVVFLDRPTLRYGRGVRCTLLLAGGAMLVSFLPVPASLRHALLPEGIIAPGPGGFALLTTDADRTMQSVLYFFALLVLFLLFGSMRRKQLAALTPFFWAGVAGNGVVAAIQITGGRGGGTGLLNGAGFFSNQNHFAALLYMGIPLLVASIRTDPGAVVPGGALLFVFLGEILTGSRAGIALAIALAGLSIPLVPDDRPTEFRRPGRGPRLALAVVIASIAVLAASGSISQRDIDSVTGRYDFARNTIAGIARSFPLGYGYGAFPLAYPMFQSPSEVVDRFVNHAHDDYLEAVFEGGLPALVVIVAYFLILGRAALRARTTKIRVVLLSIGAVLLQSVVDYPLRTFAVGAVFAWLNAQVFCNDADASEPAISEPRCAPDPPRRG